MGGPNPTLTKQALARRTAGVILRRCFGGDAWMQRDAPVSSVSGACTRAVSRQGLCNV